MCAQQIFVEDWTAKVTFLKENFCHIIMLFPTFAQAF